MCDAFWPPGFVPPIFTDQAQQRVADPTKITVRTEGSLTTDTRTARTTNRGCGFLGATTPLDQKRRPKAASRASSGDPERARTS
jgi:hypothetical protein